jgi:hypothetical protein
MRQTNSATTLADKPADTMPSAPAVTPSSQSHRWRSALLAPLIYRLASGVFLWARVFRFLRVHEQRLRPHSFYVYPNLCTC